jgi:hypothetical protein
VRSGSEAPMILPIAKPPESSSGLPLNRFNKAIPNAEPTIHADKECANLLNHSGNLPFVDIVSFS